jgi:hypothetical protein
LTTRYYCSNGPDMIATMDVIEELYRATGEQPEMV